MESGMRIKGDGREKERGGMEGMKEGRRAGEE